MTFTEKEIFSQPESLRKTYDHIIAMKDGLLGWLGRQPFQQCIFTGCGSSHCICLSAESEMRLMTKMPVWSIPSGDLLMNFDQYAGAVSGSLLVAFSRSGSTSEVIGAAGLALRQKDVRLLAVTACSGSRLSSELPCFSLELPWAFDNSVCQTQTVSNLYLAAMMICAIIAHDDARLLRLKEAVDGQKTLLATWSGRMRELSKAEWSKAVVLADGPLCGIAQEGALAFNEICGVPSNYYHILDVRHGPMVLIDGRTLVAIAAPRPSPLLENLLADLKAKGAEVLLLGPAEFASSADVSVPARESSGAALGLPFIGLLQMLCLYRALENGVNPDQPQGLDPWINLVG